MSESYIASITLTNGSRLIGEVVEENDDWLIVKRPVGIRIHTHPVGVETYDWQPFSTETEWSLDKRSLFTKISKINLYGYYIYQSAVDKIYEEKRTNEVYSKNWFEQIHTKNETVFN